jgi:hypothetical protein
MIFLFVNAFSLARLYREVKCSFSTVLALLEKTISLVAVGVLQGGKHPDVMRLELAGGVRGEATQDDVVFETKL